jgi:hypothetical protein
MVAAAIGIALMFVTGIIAGVGLMVSAAIRTQDKRRTLSNDPPDRAPHAAQRLNGLGVRDFTPRDAEDLPR